MLIAAACLLIGMPTTVLEQWKFIIWLSKTKLRSKCFGNKQGLKKSDKWYKLKIDKLPENMEAIDDSAMKYSFKDNYAMGGFSFVLSRVGENADFQTLYSKVMKKKR